MRKFQIRILKIIAASESDAVKLTNYTDGWEDVTLGLYPGEDLKTKLLKCFLCEVFDEKV